MSTDIPSDSGQGPTLSDRAFQAIVSLILDGQVEPGAILNEVDLARQLQMSRGPVREALSRLEGRRLITRKPFQRARVVSLDADSIREIFQFREGLEGVACRLATIKMSDEALARLGASLEADSSLAIHAIDRFDFHSEIALHSGNKLIADTLCDELYYLLRLYRSKSAEQPGRRDDAKEEHWQILEAMRCRRAPLAESLMRSHVRRAMESLIEAAAT